MIRCREAVLKTQLMLLLRGLKIVQLSLNIVSLYDWRKCGSNESIRLSRLQMNSLKRKEIKNLSLSFHIKEAITMYDYFNLSIVTEIEHAQLLFQLSMECF